MALDRITKISGSGVNDPLILSGDLSANNGNFVGVITAGTFSGSFIGTIVGSATSSGYATTAFSLEGTPDIFVGNVSGSDAVFTGVVTATDASFSGNVSIAGTLTYEDVKNVDSIGLITARSGVIVQSGGIDVTGVSTFVGIVTAQNDLFVGGDARIVGVLTVGSSSIKLDGSSNTVNVGSGITLSHSDGIFVGDSNLHSGGLDLGSGNILSHNIYSTGIVTASSFRGDGSFLTGISAGYWEQTITGISTSSSVGIGTTITATDTLLHLNKIGGTESIIRFTNSTTGTGVGDGAIVGLNVDENLVVSHFETKDIILVTSNTNRLKVKSDGKVGVGTNYDPSYTFDVDGDLNFTGNIYQNGTLFESGSSLTVTEVSTPGGSINVSVSDVSQIQFNNGSGFNVTDEGSGSVLIDLGSNFNPWYVDGQATLKASGEEAIEIIAGPGIAITTKPVASVGIGTTFSKAITFSADGNSINGIGTAVPNTNAEFYYSGPLRIESTTIVDVPDEAESNVAYTRHTEIVVETGADLIIADGDEIITDVLDISSPSIINPLGQLETTPISVQDSGSTVGTGITIFNFNTDLSVSVDGSTATVNSTASGGGGGVSEALAIAYAIAL